MRVFYSYIWRVCSLVVFHVGTLEDCMQCASIRPCLSGQIIDNAFVASHLLLK